MVMSEKCHSNNISSHNKNNKNSDNPLTSRRTDGGKNVLGFDYFLIEIHTLLELSTGFLSPYLHCSCMQTDSLFQAWDVAGGVSNHGTFDLRPSLLAKCRSSTGHLLSAQPFIRTNIRP